MSEHYASGTTPLPSDTERVLLVKLLNAFNAGGPIQPGTVLSHNNPVNGDTERRLLFKILRALNGI